jgi:transcriptional regulator with XRE-family HTH domain
MPESHQSRRKPLSEAYARLGSELKRIRKAANKTTREIQKPDGSWYQSGSISNVEGGYSQPSVDLIKAYARLGGRYVDLMTMLEQAKKPTRETSLPGDEFEEQLLNLHADPYILRRGYAVDLEEDTAYIGPRWAATRNVHTVSIRPLSPHTRYFVFRYGYDEDPRRGVALPQAGSGCEIALVEEDDDGTIYVVIEFMNERRDQFGRCNFSWAINIMSDAPADPLYAVHTRALMAHVVQRVQFEPPALPEKIWWFRGSDPFQETTQPSQRHIFDLNPTNFYFHEFYDVEREQCGLAWKWGPLP